MLHLQSTRFLFWGILLSDLHLNFFRLFRFLLSLDLVLFVCFLLTIGYTFAYKDELFPPSSLLEDILKKLIILEISVVFS